MKKFRCFCLIFAIVLLIATVFCMFAVQSSFAKYTEESTSPAPQVVASFEYNASLTHVDVDGNSVCDTCEKVMCMHETLEYTSNGDGTHTGVCKSCGNYSTTDTCSGGTATCQSKKVCDICNTEYGDVDASNHTNIQEILAVAATCTSTGLTEGKKCSDCGVITLEQVEVEKLPHTEDGGTVTTPATCTKEGTKTYKCTVCGETTRTESVEMTAHTASAAVQENRVEPTCTAEGSYDEVVYCKDCNVEMSRTQQTIPVADHTEVNGGEEAVHTKCSVCGVTISTAHSYTDKVTAPTCTAGGYTTRTCDCGYTYQTAQTPATGHTEVNGGEETVHTKCSVCGVTISTSHSYTNTVTAPTCTAGGYTTHTCNCGYSYTDTPVAQLAHTYTVYQSKNATQHTYKCTTCSATQTSDHTWNGGTETTAPTCTATGVKTFTCTAAGCGGSKTESIAKTEHVYATAWTYNDNQHWHKCTNTSCTSTSGTANHSFTYTTNNNNTHNASCSCGKSVNENCSGGTATCVAKATCSKCKTAYGNVSSTHSWNSSLSSDATNHWYACKVSGCTATKDKTTHTANSTWSTDGSNHWKDCTTCGYDTNKGAHDSNTNGGTSDVHKKCSTCGRTTSTTHSYTTTTQTAATCTSSGTAKNTCSCGYTYTSTISALGHNYVQDSEQGNATNVSGRIYCSRCGTTFATPAEFVSAYEIAYESTGKTCSVDAGGDTNWGWWAHVVGSGGQCFQVNTDSSDLTIGQYIVIKYGLVEGVSAQQFDIVVGEGGNAYQSVHRLDTVTSGAGVELITLGNNVGNQLWYLTQQATDLYVWSIAGFDSKEAAQAYQKALCNVAMPNGQKPVNKGDATRLS